MKKIMIGYMCKEMCCMCCKTEYHNKDAFM